ncbi:MAG: hypothetical protein CMQ49_11440 [Gammaproteobacteria bacterium]|nr:hypothetical protein [Gammaproteobacteria bacterium]
MPVADLEPSEYRLLALAGVVQAAAVVQATATGQPVHDVAHHAVLAAITTQSASSHAEVFGDPANFALGLATLHDALSDVAIAPDTARYILHLIELSRRLRRNAAVTKELGTLLDALPPDVTVFGLGHVYEETIAHLGKRVQVTGEAGRLQQDSVAAEVRALLLGGIRFAWLWHQLGGRRWHLVLRRSDVLLALQHLQNKLLLH